MATAIAPQSPSSSPRLPSPPPMAEDQAGPLSPLSPPGDQSGFPAQASTDQGAARRIRPGTKAADMSEGPPLVELSEIDSAFQLTEHLKALYDTYTHPSQLPTTQPITRETASRLAQVPPGTERSLWLYELCRFLVQKINVILTSLFTDDPPCSGITCPEMRASEWQYLCAVHDPPKSCCAIDYCCHTLDWAANTLTSPKFFPSRLALGADSSAPQTSAMQGVTRQHQERQLTNVFRRVYRIFAHAWFQHREVFWRVEGRTGLYVLFKTVCDSYALIPEDNYTIPPEAEGLEGKDGSNNTEQPQAPAGGILKRSSDAEAQSQADAGAATARRHRHAPSRSGSTVQTVIEENEEDDNTNPSSSSSSSVQPSSSSVQPSSSSVQPSSQPNTNAQTQFPKPPQITHSKTALHDTDIPASSSSSSSPHDALPALSTNMPQGPPPPETDADPSSSTPAPEHTTAGYQIPSSHSTVSPTSPLAMTSAEIAAAEVKSLPSRPAPSRDEEVPVQNQNQNQKGNEEGLAASEAAAKAALTKAEGLQAGTGDVADAEAAGKTVDD